MAQFVFLKSLGFVPSQFSVNYKQEKCEKFESANKRGLQFCLWEKVLTDVVYFEKRCKIIDTKFCLPKNFVRFPENTNLLAEENKKKIMQNYEKTLNNRSKK